MNGHILQNTLGNETMAAYAASLWRDSRRGVSLSGLDAAIATAMDLHTELWGRWDALAAGVVDDETMKALHHIQEDASVIMQVFTADPIEIREFYYALVDKGFSHLHAIHTIAIALADEAWRAEHSHDEFDVYRYVRGARMYVNGYLQRNNRRTRVTSWADVQMPDLAAAI